MIYLLWGVLNILLILGWIWIGFSLLFKTKSFQPRHSKLYSVVFIFGLIGLLAGNKKIEKNETKQPNKPATFSHLEVGKTLTHHLEILILKDNESNQILPQFTQANLTGFVAGLDWELLGLSKIENKLEVRGILTWRIFGLKLYSQPQSYQIESNLED